MGEKKPALPSLEGDQRGARGESITLPMRLVDPTLPAPAYHSSGAAAFDLYSRQTCTVPAHGEHLIPLNVVVHVPDGWGLFICARSSTIRRRGLILGNGIGLVDPDYRGDTDEVCAVVHNVRNVPVIVDRGERIAQAYLLPLPRVQFVPIAEVAPSRGGFGSTGTH